MSSTHVALVTGGGQGIGAAIVRRLASQGVFTLVAGRNHDRLDAVVAEVRGAGGAARALELDLTDSHSIQRALAEVASAPELPGPIDWLVNNAGIAVSAPLLEPGDLYERHMSVNFEGPRRLIEALLPGMLERSYGRIVNMASSAGLQGYAYVAAYCASKHALVGYSRAAADELVGKGVGLNVVCPHYVDSPMTDVAVQRVVGKTKKSEQEVRDFFARQNPGGRLVSVEEVADSVWELLAGDAHGRIVEIDGS